MFTQHEILDIVLAALLAHRLEASPPVWIAVIGQPSSGKTSILSSIPSDPVPDTEIPTPPPGPIIALDGMTRQSLASGYNKVNKAGLLERLSYASLLVKELSVIGTREKELRSLMGTLRRLYDGEYYQTFGNSKIVSWQGKLTFVFAGVLHPAQLDAELGARLLTVRLSESKTDYRRIAGGGKDTNLSRHAEEVLQRTIAAPTRGSAAVMTKYACDLSLLRSAVPRDHRGNVCDAPLTEEPHRLIAQLAAFASGLAAVYDCGTLDPRVLNTIARVVSDSIPPVRKTALQLLTTKQANKEKLVSQISEAHPVNRDYARNALEELAMLGITKERRVNTGRRGRPALYTMMQEEYEPRLRRYVEM